MAKFDVFISHNSEDKTEVLVIAEHLAEMGLAPWFDMWELTPGTLWQKGLAEGIESCDSTALFVGTNGVGPWQNAEAMLILNKAFADEGHRFIPVILPSHSGQIPELPPFSNLFTWVDFRQGLDDPDAMRRLVAGIRGEAPGRPVKHSQLDQSADRWLPKLDITQCLEPLGVPESDREAVTRWLLANIDGQLRREQRVPRRLRGQPVTLENVEDLPSHQSWRPGLDRAIRSLLAHLLSFLQPERLIASSFYVSTEKVNRLFRSYSGSLPNGSGASTAGPDDESLLRKFLLLHQYFNSCERLVFAPTQVLLGRQLPVDGDTWVYFTGEFYLGVDLDNFRGNEELRPLIEGAGSADSYNLAHRIFGSPDPFFFPVVEFTGRMESMHEAVMIASRKYINIESYSIGAFARALQRNSLPLAGFGTLHAQQPGVVEIHPIAFRLTNQDSIFHEETY
ncbi:toll/interleukin-1 receptor domain-containing protein [Streptomyces milbemycinicus]|uniref:toll/interleukin-1 receptor domain-containing protein n=1 Tax=Streptomyces milbemycinicus TaxID=476552 RepID=UPI0033E5ADBF